MNAPLDRPLHDPLLEAELDVAFHGEVSDPDSGEQLASAISAKGVRNVFFVEGGAPALRRLERQP